MNSKNNFPYKSNNVYINEIICTFFSLNYSRPIKFGFSFNINWVSLMVGILSRNLELQNAILLLIFC